MADDFDAPDSSGPGLVAGAGLDENADAFAAIKARAELEEVSDRRADRAAAAMPSDDGMTAIEAARRIAQVLTLSAEKLRIPLDIGLDELLQRILSGARRGGLDPLAYRVVWTLARACRDAPRDEAAAS